MKQQSRQSAWRHRRAQLAAQAIEGGLPMPCATDELAKVTTAEQYEYAARRENHLAQHPDYDAGWQRPQPETARAVFALLRDHLPVSLDAIHPDPLTAAHLVLVTLDVAGTAGRYGRAQRQHGEADSMKLLRRVRRNVTRTALFDAVARRWSDHHRRATETGRAFGVHQMRESTVMAVQRDLLLLGIAFPILWSLVTAAKTSAHPLFHVNRSKREGYNVTLNAGPILGAFERLVREDATYGPPRAQDAWRLWVTGQEMPPINVHAPIVAEQRYNEVTTGAGTDEVIAIQKTRGSTSFPHCS